MSEPTTAWAALHAGAAKVSRTLSDSLEAAVDHLTAAGSLSPDQRFGAAFGRLHAGAQEALEQAMDLQVQTTDLQVQTGQFAPPAPPLEAVLGEIEAEGHEYVMYGHGYAGRLGASISTRLRGTRYTGATVADHKRWVAEVEDGEAEDPDPVKAAEARLEQIKVLHAEKLAAAGLAADVPDDVKRRALDAIAAGVAPRTLAMDRMAGIDPVAIIADAFGAKKPEGWKVSCCDRLLPTQADAERHEADHLSERGRRRRSARDG